jgi:hypothetical protein
MELTCVACDDQTVTAELRLTSVQGEGLEGGAACLPPRPSLGARG